MSESSFGLDKFIIKEATIQREPNKQEEDFTLDIDPSGLINYNTNKFILELRLNVTDKGNAFKASVLALAQFNFTNSPSKELENYFYINAPAIIFPYLRAYITSLTALSGLKAVNLPIQNLSYLKDELVANTKTEGVRPNS